MKILTQMCTSLDGRVTTPAGWPVVVDDDPARLVERLRDTSMSTRYAAPHPQRTKAPSITHARMVTIVYQSQWEL